jgi:hypothetical protein
MSTCNGRENNHEDGCHYGISMKKALQEADYRIFVEGTLDPLMLDWLGNFEITEQRQPGQPVLTLLEGRLKDQFTLQGVLDTLCMLGVCLIRLERLPLAQLD